MSIVVLGCSYACGEWKGPTLTDPGITQYLSEAGYAPINLAVPGNTLMWMLKHLPNFLLLNKHLDISEILLVQTDISRNFRNSDFCQGVIDFNLKNKSSVKQTLDSFYQDFYAELSKILAPYDIRTYIVGGLTDVTVDLSIFKNMTLLIKSLCNLLDPTQDDNVRITEVHSWKLIGNMFPNCKQEIIEMIDQSHKRNDFFKASEYFPDNFHPNREAHKLIFEKYQQLKNHNV